MPIVATYKMIADLPEIEEPREWWETLEAKRQSRPVEGVERPDDEELLRAMDAAANAFQAGRSYARLLARGEEEAIDEIIKWARLGALAVVFRYVSPPMFEALFYPYRFAGGDSILEPGNRVWPARS